MSRTVRALWVAVVALLSSAPIDGRAEELDRARELFKAGLDDMLAGRFETGCPSLAESYRISEMSGALFTLAECEAKWGKLASARAHYQQYLTHYVSLSPADRTRQAERKAIAADQVEALEGTVPRLTITLPKGAVTPTSVDRDGKPLASQSFGLPVAVDPGEHRVVVKWQGGVSEQYTRTLKPGERAEIVLEPPPASGTGDGVGAGPGDGEGTEGSNGSAMMTAGYVVGAVGIAGLIAGGVTGGLAIGAKEGVVDNCVGTVCTQEGKDAADETQTLGNTSTATFAIGGAALAVGVILLLLAPDGDDPSEVSAPEQGARAAVSLRPLVFSMPEAGTSALAGLHAHW